MLKHINKLSTLSIISLAVSRVNFVYAQVGITNISAYNSLEELLAAMFSLLQPIVAIAFVAMIFYGGWVYLTSQGEAEKIAKAKQIIVAAIVGFTIIVLAPSIVRLIASIVGVNPDLVRVS